MANRIPGYHGVLLDVNLSTGKVQRKPLSPEDAHTFIGGRGLGMKLLWDAIPEPGVDPLSAENPLMFMTGPYSGLPIPSASRTCVVTKSPLTSPMNSGYPHASTLVYSNVGGFFGPEIKFAGYDGIIVTGKADKPVYLFIEDDRVEIRDARKFWGMKTNDFDKEIIKELGDRKFETCCIGPAGENRVRFSAIVHTSARAAARGGVGCVMGSKNLKAIAVKGTKMANVADQRMFIECLENARKTVDQETYFRYGTARLLTMSSEWGSQAVKNFREGTFPDIDRIGAVAAEQNLWVRDTSCYCCPMACHKVGVVRDGPYAGIYHDGPEYETGTMLGPNLLISDLGGLMKEIADADNYGMDIISLGNVLGFLMEAYDKGYLDRNKLDGVDLKWGNVESAITMIDKIARRDGFGDRAAQGVKSLSSIIGRDSHKFAIHCKGQEVAAWNVHVDMSGAMTYVTANKGACHLNGESPARQNFIASVDSLGVCMFVIWAGVESDMMASLLRAITGQPWDAETYLKAGERIFNLEKCFNYREGFRRHDDSLPDRFFEEPLTVGPHKGAILKRDEFEKALDDYYTERDWDPRTTKPSKEKLSSLGLEFAWDAIKNL